MLTKRYIEQARLSLLDRCRTSMWDCISKFLPTSSQRQPLIILARPWTRSKPSKSWSVLFTSNFVGIFVAEKCGAISSASKQLTTQCFLLYTIQKGVLRLTRAYASLEVQLFPNEWARSGLVVGNSYLDKSCCFSREHTCVTGLFCNVRTNTHTILLLHGAISAAAWARANETTALIDFPVLRIRR